jgi:hypothetical protein
MNSKLIGLLVNKRDNHENKQNNNNNNLNVFDSEVSTSFEGLQKFSHAEP